MIAVVFVVVAAYALEVRGTAAEQPLSHCPVVESFCEHLGRGEDDPVASVPQFIGHFDASHQAAVEEYVVHVHRKGSGEFPQVHFIRHHSGSAVYIVGAYALDWRQGRVAFRDYERDTGFSADAGRHRLSACPVQVVII